jgi:hypothetical protein
MTVNLRSRLTDLAEEVRPVDLRDRVLAGSRRVGIRNAVLGSVATVVVLALLGVGAAAVLNRPHPTNLPLDLPPSAGVPNRGPLTIPASEWQGVHDLDGKPLEIPAVPGNPGCSGPVTLDGGSIPVGPLNSSWYLVLRKVLRVDVDRDGTPDTVALFRCGGETSEWTQVVVFTGADRHVLGTVVQAPRRVTSVAAQAPGTPDVEDVADIAAGPDGAISVTVGDVADWYDAGTGWLGLTQTRTYRWDGHGFTQAAGPTRFDPRPGIDLALYPADYQYLNADDGTVLRFTVRNRGSVAVAGAQIELLLPPGMTPKPGAGDVTGCTQAGTTRRYLCPIGALPARGIPKEIEIDVAGAFPVQGHADLQARVVPVAPGLGTDSSDGHHWVRFEVIRVK